MYTTDQEEIKREIRRLARERNALLLAHNYQRDEIQEIADITGDSLGLSQEAAQTACEVIVFCGRITSYNVCYTKLLRTLFLLRFAAA